jgi:NADP-dependent aldehyde dehydrogenase
MSIQQITQNALHAFEQYIATSTQQRAAFLESIAEEIEALGDTLLETANKETNLPLARLQGERGRTCFQLRMFAAMLLKGDYVDAIIETAIPTKTPPKPDIRSMYQPMGPVVVFGASNFPFAYSTAGGDTASALAVGCPVIVKAHPAHIHTSNLVAGAIEKAIEKHQMPKHVFQHVDAASLGINEMDLGKILVQDEAIAAVGFTGSRNGGRALLDYATARKSPIPVFAEMGSVNPVILLEEIVSTQAENLATQYAGSITLGVGQFCTNPGILIGIQSKELNEFAHHLANAMKAYAPSTMLHEGIQAAYFKNSIAAITQKGVCVYTGQNPDAENAYPVLATVEATSFLANPLLAEEVFGPYSILVQCKDLHELKRVWSSLQGQISTTIMGTDKDLNDNKALLEKAFLLAGRVVINGVPTGVEVCDSMVHGGPYPASTDSRFTAVGVNATKRWLRPVSYQNWPDNLLPLALQNSNPLNIVRSINGQPSKETL